MAITGILPIQVATQQNQASGSDSLFTAFNTINTNFTRLGASASPFNSFGTGGPGLAVTTNSNTGAVTYTNTGVTQVVAGTGVTVSQNTGVVTISMTGTGNVGVTSVGIVSANNSINVSNVTGNLVSSGVFNLELPLITQNIANTPVSIASTYTNPTITVDAYGRIIGARSTQAGQVSSVTVTAGSGISIAAGPDATNPQFTITNTGIRNVRAGVGISVISDGNGGVTVNNTQAAGGGAAGSVTNVAVRAIDENVLIGPSAANATANGSYASSTNVSFAVGINPNVSVTGVTTTTLTVSNNSTFIGPVTVSSGTTLTTARVLSLLQIPTTPPSSNVAAGALGQITYGNGYIYICTQGGPTGNAVWQRAAMTPNWP